MESFFLAETIKYLYLLFDADNFIHNTGGHGTKIQTPNGECIIDTGSYIFNTEGHPVDTAALYCCSAEKKEDDAELQNFHDNLDLLTLLDIHDHDNTIQGVKWNPRKRNEKSNTGGILGDLKLGGSKWKSSFKGDHQNILSTEGKVFTIKDLNIPVVNLNVHGGKVVVENSKMGVRETKSKIVEEGSTYKDHVTREEQEKSSDSLSSEARIKLKEIKIGGIKDLKETCDISEPGNDCKAGIEESTRSKYVFDEKDGNIANEEDYTENNDESNDEMDNKRDANIHETVEEKYGLKLTTDLKKSADKDKDVIDDDGSEEEEENDDSDNDNRNKEPTVQKPAISLGHHDSIHLKDSILEINNKEEIPKSGLEKLNEIMELLKSMTTGVLTQSSVNVRTLYDKLKYYSLFKISNPELMTCKAQPFYMRFSAMGEMFLEDS